MKQKKITKKELFEIISENICIGIQDITEDSRFIEDLGCDSIDRMEVTFDIENFLSIQIDDEQFDGFKKVSDLLNYLKVKGMLKEDK